MITFGIVALSAIIVLAFGYRVVNTPTERGPNQRAALQFTALPLGIMIICGALLGSSEEARLWAENHQQAIFGCLGILAGWSLISGGGDWWSGGVKTLGYIFALAALIYLVTSGFGIDWDKFKIQSKPASTTTVATRTVKPVKEVATKTVVVEAPHDCWGPRLDLGTSTDFKFATSEPVDVRIDDGTVFYKITSDVEMGKAPINTQGLRFHRHQGGERVTLFVHITGPNWRQ